MFVKNEMVDECFAKDLVYIQLTTTKVQQFSNYLVKTFIEYDSDFCI